MRLILCEPKKVSAIGEFVSLAALYYSTLLWFPYYFTNSVYKEEAIYFAILGSLSIVIGTYVMERFLSRYKDRRHWMIFRLLLLAAALQLAML